MQEVARKPYQKVLICTLLKALPRAQTNSKPSTKKLLLFVDRIAPNWYQVGAVLLEEEQEGQLRLIEAQYVNDVTKCCFAMLQFWMSTHPEATWHHLVIALKSPGVNLAAVAYDIEKNYIAIVDHSHRDIDSSNIINFADFKNVADAFAALTGVFTKELCDTDFELIRTACLIRADKKLKNGIGRTTNFHMLWTVFACNPFYFNWMSVEYLQTMAAASGNETLKDVIKSYSDVVLSKTLGEIWNLIPSFHQTKTKYYSKVKAKFHGKDPDDITVEDLKKYKPKFAKEIALHIMVIERGSLIITWSILSEDAYQAYLLALSIPQESRNDDLLQIGPWVIFHPQFVIQKLRTAHDAMVTTSTLLIGYYHGLLMSSIDAGLLTDKMISVGLLTVNEKIVISSGHSVQQRNWLLLQLVQQMDVQAVATFSELVQEIWPQVGSQLITALRFKDSSVSDQSPFDASGTTQSEGEDVGIDMTSSSAYVLFLCLIDQIAKLLQSYTFELVQSCKTLKASDVHNISLFSADQMKELSDCNETSSLLLKLSLFFTWSNCYTLLRALVGCSSEAVKLLDKFESKIDPLQPITSYPIPSLSADMIPGDTSAYTILAVRCKVELYESSLQYIYDVQSVMMEKCDITQHCLQLLAVRSDPTILYWTIPKCVVYLINTNVPLHSEYLYSIGILEVLVYPDLMLTTGDDICLKSTVFTCHEDISSEKFEKHGFTDSEVMCKENKTLCRKVKKELEEMKLKFNLLDEENAKLESQIFVMHKQMEQSKVEYRKLVGRCRELKDRQWNDVGCQTDLLKMCTTIDNYGRMLCEAQVQFTFGEHTNKHGFIKIYCIGVAGHPARIEVFDNKKTASKGKPLLYQIPFENVKNIVTIEVQGKPRTAITIQGGDTFIFSSSDSNKNTELLGYSKLLRELPNYVIPEIPKRCLVPQQYIEQYSDCSKYNAAGIWVVYLINEGVGPNLKFTGLHIVTIRTTTFNIYNFYNEKHLLAWEHCNIRRSGYVGPLVFLEIGWRCQGGPGVLWMYYPTHLAGEFRESLHRFLHDNAKDNSAPTETEPISVDANLDRTYQSRQQSLPRGALSQDAPSQYTPPPLPAKPQTESLSLLEERMPVQPSQSQEWQRKLEKTNAKPRDKKFQIQSAAFQACSRILTDKLDIKTIIPELNSCHLLTKKDHQFLINPMHEDYDKVLYLLYCLPRKGNEWFDKFLWCLDQSSSNTGHGDIISSLREKLKELEDQNADIIPLVSNPIPVSSEHVDDTEPYTVFLDSPDIVDTLQVRSSERVPSLMERVRQKFNISPAKPLRLEVDDHQLSNSADSSLFDSKINRYSFITVTVLDTSS